MKILTALCFSPYWGTVPPNVLELESGPTIGGGEEAAIRTAVGLRALGHEVLCYWYGSAGVWRGVEFRPLSAPFYPVLVGEKWDAVIAWSGIRPLEWAPPGAKRILAQQLNDLMLTGFWERVDCVVSPSRNHAEMIKNAWNWHGKRAVVHNGLDPELYQGEVVKKWADGGQAIRHPATPWGERPFDVGYWSSPDRGLHHLLEAWPMVVAAEPRAKLHVFYEIKRYLSIVLARPLNQNGVRGMDLERLILRAENDPSVTFHGAVPRRVLAKTQRQCRVQCYPYDPLSYTEGFATAVNQGLAAGCLVMATPKDALPELYEDGIHWLKKSPGAAGFHAWLAEQVVQALHGKLPEQAKTIERAVAVGTRYSWAAASKQMEAACTGENWF